jgi:hypothetical protein
VREATRGEIVRRSRAAVLALPLARRWDLGAVAVAVGVRFVRLSPRVTSNRALKRAGARYGNRNDHHGCQPDRASGAVVSLIVACQAAQSPRLRHSRAAVPLDKIPSRQPPAWRAPLPVVVRPTHYRADCIYSV